jgi:type II secretory pathway pseudopilin PulG
MAAMNRQPEGFALVEAVVALAIVAFIIGAMFETLAMARSAVAGAEARREAMLEARSIVAQLGATLPLVPGTSQGQDGSLHWRVDIDTVQGREIETPLSHAVVTVGDQRGHVLARLETLRIVR